MWTGRDHHVQVFRGHIESAPSICRDSVKGLLLGLDPAFKSNGGKLGSLFKRFFQLSAAVSPQGVKRQGANQHQRDCATDGQCQQLLTNVQIRTPNPFAAALSGAVQMQLYSYYQCNCMLTYSILLIEWRVAMARYRVSELARMSGVGPRTIDYYTQQQLLDPVERSEGGHRFYGEEA